MLDRAIGIAGLALAILSIVGPKMFPDMHKKIAVAGFILGIFCLGALGQRSSSPAARPNQVNKFNIVRQSMATAMRREIITRCVIPTGYRG